MKLLQNKRDMHLKHMKQEIAQFLQAGQEPIARIRVSFLISPHLIITFTSCNVVFFLTIDMRYQVEHVIREMNLWAAYEILELFCEFVLARVPILESQKWVFGVLICYLSFTKWFLCVLFGIVMELGNARESWEKLLLALSLLLRGALKCLIFFSLRIFSVPNMGKSLSWFLLSSVLILVSIVQLIILASFLFMFEFRSWMKWFLTSWIVLLFMSRSLKSFLLQVRPERQGSRFWRKLPRSTVWIGTLLPLKPSSWRATKTYWYLFLNSVLKEC